MAGRQDSTRLAKLLELYGETGLPLTSQRRAILEVLASRADHPTVERIWTAVGKRLPEVSKTTVYRSLEILADRGLLERVEHPGSAVRYDANMDPHHHFLCTRCESLSDVPLEDIAGHGELSYTGDSPVNVHGLTVLVRGECPECLESKS